MMTRKDVEVGILVCVVGLATHAAVKADQTNHQDVVARVLAMVAKRNYSEALKEFERQGQKLEKEVPDISFYIAECHYQEGHFDQAEKVFAKVLATPFNNEEAYGRLIEIARGKADSNTVAKYTKAMSDLHEKNEREYNGIERIYKFTPDPSDCELDALRKALVFHGSSGRGGSVNKEAENLILLGRHSDAVLIWEHALHECVPLSERFSSPAARRIYERIADVYGRQAEALKRKKGSGAEAGHATVMARYYANKAAVVRSRLGTD